MCKELCAHSTVKRRGQKRERGTEGRGEAQREMVAHTRTHTLKHTNSDTKTTPKRRGIAQRHTWTSVGYTKPSFADALSSRLSKSDMKQRCQKEHRLQTARFAPMSGPFSRKFWWFAEEKGTAEPLTGTKRRKRQGFIQQLVGHEVHGHVKGIILILLGGNYPPTMDPAVYRAVLAASAVISSAAPSHSDLSSASQVSTAEAAAPRRRQRPEPAVALSPPHCATNCFRVVLCDCGVIVCVVVFSDV